MADTAPNDLIRIVADPRFPREDFAESLTAELAVRSFIGKEKSRNEDYGTVARESVDGVTYSLIVVSDGVSSSEQGHIAAERACCAGRDEIIGALRAGESDLERCLRRGIDAAQQQVLKIPQIGETLPWGPAKSPSSATFIAAIVTGGTIHILGLGDCRAYLVGADNAISLLTKDQSWVNKVVDAGEMTLSDALDSPQAHNLTGYLGPSGRSGKSFRPVYTRVEATDARLLVICSDGFWNYAHKRQDAPAEPFSSQLQLLPRQTSALTIADSLVEFANNAGGHDNITVAVLRLSD